MRLSRCLNAAALAAAAVLPFTLGTGAAHAAAIAVGNGSFEMPDVLSTAPYADNSVAAGGAQTSEQYSAQNATAGGSHSAANGDVLPYWTVTTDAANVTTSGGTEAYGADNPVGWKVKNGVTSNTEYYGTNGLPSDTSINSNGNYTSLSRATDYSFNQLAAIDDSYGYSNADGYQFAYINITNATTQSAYSATFTYDPTDALSAGANPLMSLGNFIPGETYTLSFAVGTRLDKAQWAYSGTLLDDGVPVGTAVTGNSPTSNSSSWETVTYTYTATDSGAIGIQLTGTGINTQINFDNVRLSAGAATPEPASLSVLGLGAVALLSRRRKS